MADLALRFKDEVIVDTLERITTDLRDRRGTFVRAEELVEVASLVGAHIRNDLDRAQDETRYALTDKAYALGEAGPIA